MTDWLPGDLLGTEFPTHVDALRSGGAEFLTAAFRASGALGTGDRMTEIVELEPVAGGSTGRKARLSVRYATPSTLLPTELFVKFSRDFDNELRDRGKKQMESEARFALLSRMPDFPIAVPQCLFAEYHRESGSGVIVSERIAFGADGIEPHHAKARDYEIDDPLPHYEVLVAALGRLAGTHRSGRLPPEVMAHFPPPAQKARPTSRAPLTPDDVRSWVERYARFARRYPQLLPGSITSDAFLDELIDQAPRSIAHADALRAAGQRDAAQLTVFCHWNANIDNAWFWREDGQLRCGLMDWGNVGQLNMVTALSSCLVFAEPDFVIANLDHLLDVFTAAFEHAGGGSLDAALLRTHWELQMFSGGLQWPLAAVPLIERHVPDLATVVDRFDPRIADDEFVRTQLHMLTAYLRFWQASGARAVIDRALASG